MKDYKLTAKYEFRQAVKNGKPLGTRYALEKVEGADFLPLAAWKLGELAGRRYCELSQTPTKRGGYEWSVCVGNPHKRLTGVNFNASGNSCGDVNPQVVKDERFAGKAMLILKRDGVLTLAIFDAPKECAADLLAQYERGDISLIFSKESPEVNS